VSGPRTNLPVSNLPLFGREQEHQSLLEALDAHQLVTISGPGGMGKSRLAQAVAAARIGQFDDGVWWVELASVSAAALVPDAIARAAGLVLHGGTDNLVDQLCDLSLMLVIDNCEHVIDAAADIIAAITAAAPGVRILATSQERLKLSVEHLFRLNPLAIETQDGAGPGTAGALALFAARARSVQAGFTLNSESIPIVQEICRQLDGLPLAIELAAARLPVLGLNGLQERLHDRLRVLGNASRGAPERQRTLRAALEWSHALLTPAEQTLFARLGVFVGSFDLEAAERVCADDTLEAWEVVELASALLDKSLLTADDADPPSYRLLETPRAFAIEQLHASPDARVVHARHAALMRQRLLAAQEAQWTREGSVLIGKVIRDIDNLRSALTWASGAQGDAEMLIALAGTGSVVWTQAGAEAEGLAWCELALRAVTGEVQPVLEADLLVALAKLGHQIDAGREIPALERAAALFARQGDQRGQFIALTTLAKKHIWRRDHAAADAAIRAAQTLFDASWPAAMRTNLLQAKAYLLEIHGRPADGEPFILEALSIMQSMGDPDGIDVAKIELAESYMVQGKVAESAALRREVYDRGGRAGVNAFNMANLAGAYAQLGELDAALRFARTAFPSLRKSQKLPVFIDHFALLSCKLGRVEQSARLIGRSDAHVSASGFEREVSEENAYKLTRQLLTAALQPDVMTRLMMEGTGMSDEAALAAALAEKT
jgi:predicted ATPase